MGYSRRGRVTLYNWGARAVLHETRATHPCAIPVGVHVRQGPTGSVSPHRNRQPTLLASFITIHELRTEFPGRVEANGDPVPNGPHLDRSFPLRARRSIQGVGGNVPDIADSIAGADETPAWCILGLAQADLVCEPSLFAWRVTRGPK